MNFQAIIFDWSGTLSDDRQSVYAANNRMQAYYGLPSNTFDEFLTTVTMTPIEYFRSRGVSDSGEEIYALYRRYFQESLNEGICPCVFQDAYETLTVLKNRNVSTAVVSSHPTIFLKKESQEYQLAPLLKIVRGDATNKTDSMLSVCETLGCVPAQSMYIGDTIYDIRSAKAAGLQSAGIATGYHTAESLKQEKPDYLFSNLLEIVDLFC